jgi:signal transduction histidine kinase
MQEIRAISAGLSLPQLKHLTLADTISRVVRTHERRTGTSVALCLDNIPEEVSLPVKITLYRFVQEALQNAYRHANGTGQEVRVKRAGEQVTVDVVDEGPGFEGIPITDRDEHLGLVGMRERVESLGGLFRIDSRLGQGTIVSARLALQADGGTL